MNSSLRNATYSSILEEISEYSWISSPDRTIAWSARACRYEYFTCSFSAFFTFCSLSWRLNHNCKANSHCFILDSCLFISVRGNCSSNQMLFRCQYKTLLHHYAPHKHSLPFSYFSFQLMAGLLPPDHIEFYKQQADLRIENLRLETVEFISNYFKVHKGLPHFPWAFPKVNHSLFLWLWVNVFFRRMKLYVFSAKPLAIKMCFWISSLL